MEEDIKILEDFINNEFKRDKLEIDDRCGGFKMGYIYKITELSPAIEHLLKEYKELEEENKKILNSKVGVDLSFDDYIPVSLVEEKIEELKENGYWKYLEERDLETTIDILQELLEKR